MDDTILAELKEVLEEPAQIDDSKDRSLEGSCRGKARLKTSTHLHEVVAALSYHVLRHGVLELRYCDGRIGKHPLPCSPRLPYLRQ